MVSLVQSSNVNRACTQVQLSQSTHQLQGVCGVQRCTINVRYKSCSFSSSMTDLLTRLRP